MSDTSPHDPVRYAEFLARVNEEAAQAGVVIDTIERKPPLATRPATHVVVIRFPKREPGQPKWVNEEMVSIVSGLRVKVRKAQEALTGEEMDSPLILTRLQ